MRVTLASLRFRGGKMALAAMALFQAGPAAADMISDEGLAPYEVCALCHGLDGVSAMAKFPKLAGQPAAYLEKQIHDFREGRRDNDGGQMVAIVGELDPADIPIVAEWFASQAPPPPGQASADAAALYDALGCTACHGAERSADMPRLTAQHAAYLAKQMRDFRDGRRGNGAEMAAAMGPVTDAEIEILAAWLAAQERRP